MKHNTMKRALALTLSVLTVAAPMTANVGGILQEVAIVASAASNGVYEGKYNDIQDADGDANPHIQANGLLRVETESVAFIEGLYEITYDAGKYVYTKVDGSDVYSLKKDKAYVLRTKAFMTDADPVTGSSTLVNLEYAAKDLNTEDLPDGVYEYTIKTVGATDTLNVATMKDQIKVNPTDFAEGITVMQNGNEIKYDSNKGGYEVAQGFPVEVTATPGEVHTLQMLNVDAYAAVKEQTKSSNSVTLKFIPEMNQTGVGVFTNPTTTVLSWADYQPTLKLTNDNGTIRATDVGFNTVISNAVVGTYEFKYGKQNGATFVAADTNAKGQYVADGQSTAFATFTEKKVTIGNTTYDFVEEGNTTYEYKDAEGKWQPVVDESGNGGLTVAKKLMLAGTYRATTTVVAKPYVNNGTTTYSCTLSENPFKIVTEFTVAADAVTGTKNLVFVAPTDDGKGLQRIQPSNGVYNVPWQNGDEIEPNLIIFRNAADAEAVTNLTGSVTQAINDEADKTKCFQEGKNADYTVTGTTTASDAGIYTMTITPTSKSAFNDGEEITITWQIVNTNNYVKAKKTPTGLSDKNATTNSDTDAMESAKANAQHFNIGYRQANSKSILEKITKSLDFVGSEDLTVVEYREVNWKTASAQGSKATATLPTDAGTGHVQYGDVVEDPSEKVGTYVALVANALKNDGKSSAMMKDNTVYDPDGNGTLYNAGDLYPVYFQVTKTRVRIVPDITEITYGDKVELSKLYKVIDADNGDEIGVPWEVAPTFVLKDKYSEKIVNDGADNTETLAAGEYVYGIKDGVAVLDNNPNYDVRELIAEDQTDFTVNPRNLNDMEFGTVGVPVLDPDAKNVTVTKLALAEAANAIEANPVEFAYTYKKLTIGGTEYYVRLKTANDAAADTTVGGIDYMKICEATAVLTDANKKKLVEEGIPVSTNDFNISGGTTSAKVTDLGKMLTVTIKGVGNFEGSKTITWIVGGNVLSDDVLTYEAEFDAAKPRVMAKFNTKKVDGEIEECGFYYNNNGKMNDVDTALAADLLKEVDQTGENVNQKNSKKITFTNKAVTSAISGNGLLTAEIANSSVLKQVYIMPYVKYKNGNIAYGKVDKFNYYDMVLNAEGALEMTKTDFVSDGTVGTAGKTYVKVDVTRVDKKGYTVERYGILYNNSDSWNNNTTNPVPIAAANNDQVNSKVTNDELAKAYTWLNIKYESEKTVKVAEIPEEDLATKIGTNTYIANTTAKKYDAQGKESKDYGYGAKSVFARAFIQIKDAAGNSKVYYSHLADVTYGGFTVDTVDGYVKGTEWATTQPAGTAAVTDSKNTSQIMFYAPTNALFTESGFVKNGAGATDYYTDGEAYAFAKDGVVVADNAVYYAAATAVGGVDQPAGYTNMTRMNASTGNKTFQVWWTDSKKS